MPRTATDGNGWQASLLKSRYSQSLERGLAILGCFTPDRPALGIAEIAGALGMSRTTTHRYASTLLALGYLKQDRTRRYLLTVRVTALGMSVLNATGLREHAHSHLQELCSRTSLTVSLGVLDGAEVLYVDRVRSLRPGRQKIAVNLDAGSRVALHASSIGKLLLAGLSLPEQRELLMQVLPCRLGPNTIVGRHTFTAELERIAQEGFALDDEELMAGFRSIAVPVRDGEREIVAAVAIEAHTAMVSREELIDTLGMHLLATGDHISARLGYRRDDEAPDRGEPLRSLSRA